MLKFHCDVRPVNFVSLFFFCSCSNWNLASDFSGISSGVFSYTFYRAVMSCKLGGLCLNEPDPVHVWLYKKEADVFNSFNLPFFFFSRREKTNQSKHTRKAHPKSSKAEVSLFCSFSFKSQWFKWIPVCWMPVVYVQPLCAVATHKAESSCGVKACTLL